MASDNKTVTIKIRDGVVWSDGTPFSADDVVFTITRSMVADRARGTWLTFHSRQGRGIDYGDRRLDGRIGTGEAQSPMVLEELRHRHENHVPMLPKHIWEGKDLENFTFYDPGSGLARQHRRIRPVQHKPTTDHLRQTRQLVG